MRGCDHRPLAAYLPFSQVLFDTSSGKFERTERPTCPINTPPWLTRVNNNTVANLSSCRPSPTAITVKNLLQVYKHLRSFPASKLPRYVFTGFYFVVFLLVFLTSWRHTCLLTSSWWGWRKPKVCRMNKGKKRKKETSLTQSQEGAWLSNITWNRSSNSETEFGWRSRRMNPILEIHLDSFRFSSSFYGLPITFSHSFSLSSGDARPKSCVNHEDDRIECV